MSTSQPLSSSASSAVNAVLGNSQSSAAAQSASMVIPANQQITESGFLQLISTQLQNQDPTNPTDPTQFVTQIEGLSQGSSLQSLQTSMNTLTPTMQSSQVLSGTALLGQSVLAPGTSASLAAGGSVAGAVTAPAGASALIVSISNASGALVNSFAVALSHRE